jgi:AcrR family transcriptional regulator
MSHGPRVLDHRAASGVLAEGWEPTVTMAQVASRLGLAKPTLYRLASSKEELVRICVDAETERLLEHLHHALSQLDGADALALAAEGLRAVERFAADSPGGFRLLFAQRGPHAHEALTRVEGRLADLLRRNARQAGRAPKRPDLLAAALWGAAAAVVSRAVAQDRAVDAEVVTADFTAALEFPPAQARAAD